MIPTVIKSADLKDQRYETLGDYEIKEDGTRVFTITKTGNDLYDDLIFIHEFVEEVLTRNKGIKEGDIMKFDLWFEDQVKKGLQSFDGEPGDHPLSPYRREHNLAEIIEAILLNYLNISFKEYNDNIFKVFTNA